MPQLHFTSYSPLAKYLTLTLSFFYCLIGSSSYAQQYVDQKDTLRLIEDTLKRQAERIEEVLIVGERYQKTSELMFHQMEAKNKKNGIYYNGRPPLALLNPFNGKPITFFYERFSRAGRHARAMRRNYKRSLEQEKIEAYFNPELVEQILKIPPEESQAYMESYRPEFQQVKDWSLYDAQLYIKTTYRQFLEQNSNK